MTEVQVPCAECTLCCKNGDMLRLLPSDNPDHYQTKKHPLMEDSLMLDHKKNGDCIYLRSYGCLIHNRRPQMCREMDCRLIAKKVSRYKAKTLGSAGVWDRGNELLQIRNI